MRPHVPLSPLLLLLLLLLSPASLSAAEQVEPALHAAAPPGECLTGDCALPASHAGSRAPAAAGVDEDGTVRMDASTLSTDAVNAMREFLDRLERASSRPQALSRMFARGLTVRFNGLLSDEAADRMLSLSFWEGFGKRAKVVAAYFDALQEVGVNTVSFLLTLKLADQSADGRGNFKIELSGVASVNQGKRILGMKVYGDPGQMAELVRIAGAGAARELPAASAPDAPETGATGVAVLSDSVSPKKARRMVKLVRDYFGALRARDFEFVINTLAADLVMRRNGVEYKAPNKWGEDFYHACADVVSWRKGDVTEPVALSNTELAFRLNTTAYIPSTDHFYSIYSAERWTFSEDGQLVHVLDSVQDSRAMRKFERALETEWSKIPDGSMPLD